MVIIVVLIVAIYIICVKRKRSVLLSSNEQFDFNVKESIDSPNHIDEKPDVAISEDKEFIADPPDKHVPVPEPTKKTEVEKAILDFGGFA